MSACARTPPALTRRQPPHPLQQEWVSEPRPAPCTGAQYHAAPARNSAMNSLRCPPRARVLTHTRVPFHVPELSTSSAPAAASPLRAPAPREPPAVPTPCAGAMARAPRSGCCAATSLIMQEALRARVFASGGGYERAHVAAGNGGWRVALPRHVSPGGGAREKRSRVLKKGALAVPRACAPLSPAAAALRWAAGPPGYSERLRHGAEAPPCAVAGGGRGGTSTLRWLRAGLQDNFCAPRSSLALRVAPTKRGARGAVVVRLLGRHVRLRRRRAAAAGVEGQA